MENEEEYQYKPLEEEDFDKKKFVKGYSELNGIGRSIETIVKDSANPQALRTAGKILHNNDEFYLENPKKLRFDLDDARKKGINGIDKYVSNNEDDFLGNLEEDDFKKISQNVTFNKSEEKKDKKYNDFSKLSGDYHEVSKIAESGNGIIPYLTKKVESRDDKEWLRTKFILSDDKYKETMFKAYVEYHSAKFTNAIKKEKTGSHVKTGLSLAKGNDKVLYHDFMAGMAYQNITAKAA